jgi:cation-transporting P-type ATPase 13A2
LILWSLDEYYYYAIAIFLMSVGSIATTLIETRSVSLNLQSLTMITSLKANGDRP